MALYNSFIQQLIVLKSCSNSQKIKRVFWFAMKKN